MVVNGGRYYLQQDGCMATLTASQILTSVDGVD